MTCRQAAGRSVGGVPQLECEPAIYSALRHAQGGTLSRRLRPRWRKSNRMEGTPSISQLQHSWICEDYFCGTGRSIVGDPTIKSDLMENHFVGQAGPTYLADQSLTDHPN
jgi:hypothetical protein